MNKLIPLALSAIFLHGVTQAADTAETKRITAPALGTAIMADVITPHYAQLQQASQLLTTTGQQLCSKPSPETLSATREAYLKTLLAWRTSARVFSRNR